ncbi:MAG: sensor domain-containing diguanylate cyclase [Candidatus Omnitrophota bacterium]|nr:MAG: sensor domain-containing diguanylate cyclase [Candidatus Omnitrophota bacterium]
MNFIIVLSAVYFSETAILIFGALGFLTILIAPFPSFKVRLASSFLLVATTSILYFYCAKITNFIRHNNVALENAEGEKNILSAKLMHLRTEQNALEQKLQRYSALKGLTEDLSSVLSLDAATSLIAQETSRIIGKNSVCLLYLVDRQEQELYLAASETGTGQNEIKAKKGDVFDDWVFKQRTRLMIKDANKDFRFDAYDIKKDGARDIISLISAPLISENKLLGILRMDSPSREAYAADELRLLDIIADLSAVAIENTILYQKTEHLAITDGLTGVFVYRHFQERFDQELARALWSDSEFSFLMLDIDNFKAYNDKYGHTAGDIVLKQIARLIKESCNPGDIVARYGGEEFGVLLVETGREEALKTAERIRKRIADEKFVLRRERSSVTVSGGISFFPGEGKEKEDLIRKADSALYKAKDRGRNRICTS